MTDLHGYQADAIIADELSPVVPPLPQVPFALNRHLRRALTAKPKGQPFCRCTNPRVEMRITEAGTHFYKMWDHPTRNRPAPRVGEKRQMVSLSTARAIVLAKVQATAAAAQQTDATTEMKEAA